MAVYAFVWLVLGDDPRSETRWSLNSYEPRYSDRYIPAGHEVTFTYLKRDFGFTPEQNEALGYLQNSLIDRRKSEG